MRVFFNEGEGSVRVRQRLYIKEIATCNKRRLNRPLFGHSRA